MLVLSRKMGQSIVINENVTLVVLQVKGNQVRLGIAAPSDVNVRRGEIDKLDWEKLSNARNPEAV